jgi:hypothetical protein
VYGQNNFTKDLLVALHDKDIRQALSQILLEPILDRVRELEINNDKHEKKIKILVQQNKSLEEKYTNLETEVKTLKEQKKNNSKSLVAPLQNEITNLKHKTNINQRMTDQDRRNNVVIHGIKESKDESAEELTTKVNTILNKADLKIEGTFEVVRLGKVTALNSEQRIRPVKVSLSNHWDKRIIYKARTTMKAKENFGIFINEDIPKLQQTLLMHCRQARRQKKLVSCWTEEGVVHVRTTDIDDIIITDLQQLKKDTGYIEKESTSPK